MRGVRHWTERLLTHKRVRYSCSQRASKLIELFDAFPHCITVRSQLFFRATLGGLKDDNDRAVIVLNSGWEVVLIRDRHDVVHGGTAFRERFTQFPSGCDDLPCHVDSVDIHSFHQPHLRWILNATHNAYATKYFADYLTKQSKSKINLHALSFSTTLIA